MALEIRALESTWTAISAPRRSIWEALAKLIKPTNNQVEPLSPDHTLFIPPQVYERGTTEMSEHVATTIRKRIGAARNLDLLIIDVSANQYEDLPETLMCHVMSGAAIAAAELELHIEQLVLLYPKLAPPRDSPSLQLLRNYQYHVISPEATFFHPANAIEDSTSDAYVEYPNPPTWHGAIAGRISSLENTEGNQGTLGELRSRLIQRIGHFERVDCDPPMCSKYFWDGSRATGTIADMLADRVNATGEQRPDVIAYHAPLSHWIEETANLVASKLEVNDIVKVADIPEDRDFRGKSVLLIVDLVHHGHACAEAIAILSDREMIVSSTVLSVMIEIKSTGSILQNGVEYNIAYLLKVNIDESKQSDCEQCQWGLMPVSPKKEEPESIGPYEMWLHVLNNSPWVGEKDKPKTATGRKGFERTPDLQKAIRDHGNWFALKFFGILEGSGQSANVTLVGPDEMGTQLIAKQIENFSTGTVTTVLLPRSAIERVAVANDVERQVLSPARRKETHWVRRLDHLSRADERVVLIDEFNASGHTALALLKLMNTLSVAIEFYFCIWDRCPSAFVGRSIAAHSLYRFESPRHRSV